MENEKKRMEKRKEADPVIIAFLGLGADWGNGQTSYSSYVLLGAVLLVMVSDGGARNVFEAAISLFFPPFLPVPRHTKQTSSLNYARVKNTDGLNWNLEMKKRRRKDQTSSYWNFLSNSVKSFV